MAFYHDIRKLKAKFKDYKNQVEKLSVDDFWDGPQGGRLLMKDGRNLNYELYLDEECFPKRIKLVSKAKTKKQVRAVCKYNRRLSSNLARYYLVYEGEKPIGYLSEFFVNKFRVNMDSFFDFRSLSDIPIE